MVDIDSFCSHNIRKSWHCFGSPRNGTSFGVFSNVFKNDSISVIELNNMESKSRGLFEMLDRTFIVNN